ncbi:MAG: hypothetical protein WBN04_13425 [Paracoccaceae bacterium]
MSEPENDGRRAALMVLLALWAGAWGWSLVPLFSVPTGEELAEGQGQVQGFLGWQAIAGLLALALWGTARGFPRQSGLRRISGVPLGMALALLLALGASWLWVALNP